MESCSSAMHLSGPTNFFYKRDTCLQLLINTILFDRGYFCHFDSHHQSMSRVAHVNRLEKKLTKLISTLLILNLFLVF